THHRPAAGTAVAIAVRRQAAEARADADAHARRGSHGPSGRDHRGQPDAARPRRERVDHAVRPRRRRVAVAAILADGMARPRPRDRRALRGHTPPQTARAPASPASTVTTIVPVAAITAAA